MKSPDQWQRYAQALDLRLAGWPYYAIGNRSFAAASDCRTIAIYEYAP